MNEYILQDKLVDLWPNYPPAVVYYSTALNYYKTQCLVQLGKSREIDNVLKLNTHMCTRTRPRVYVNH